MTGWDVWIVSLTWRTWVWASFGSWWWTRKPGMLQSMGSQRVGHDWERGLNWRGNKEDENEVGQIGREEPTKSEPQFYYKKINKVRDRKMKVKHTYLVESDGKQVEGQVKVAIRVLGLKHRYWRLLFYQLAQNPLHPYLKKTERIWVSLSSVLDQQPWQ